MPPDPLKPIPAPQYLSSCVTQKSARPVESWVSFRGCNIWAFKALQVLNQSKHQRDVWGTRTAIVHTQNTCTYTYIHTHVQTYIRYSYTLHAYIHTCITYIHTYCKEGWPFLTHDPKQRRGLVVDPAQSLAPVHAWARGLKSRAQ